MPCFKTEEADQTDTDGSESQFYLEAAVYSPADAGGDLIGIDGWCDPIGFGWMQAIQKIIDINFFFVLHNFMCADLPIKTPADC